MAPGEDGNVPSATTVAELAVVVSADTKPAETALSSFGESIKQGVGIGVGFGLLEKGLELAGKAFGTAKGAAIDFNATLEQATIGFTSMLGSGEKAQAFLTDLQQFAAQTPFKFPELLDASKRMLAFGFSAQEVRPLLTAVGSAAAAMGGGSEGVDQITRALGQMRAATVVQAGELNQLTEAGVPAFQLLADKLGITTGEVKNLVSQGKIASSVFIDAFQAWAGANFGDMMAKQALTFSGAMSTIEDSVQMAAAKAFRPLFELLSQGAVALSQFVQTDQFNAWADAVATAMQEIARQVADAGRTVVQVFQHDWSPSQTVDPFVNGIGMVATVIRDLLPVLQSLATFLWDNRDAIAAVVAALATFVILTTIIGWVTAFAAGIAAVTTAISASGGVLAALGALVALLGGPVTLIIAAIALAVGALAYAWANNWGDIQGKTAAVVEFLSRVPGRVAGFFEAIGQAADGLKIAVERAWNAIKTATETVWNGIKQFLEDWWRTILIVLGGPVGAVAVLIIDNWEAIKRATETIFAAIQNILIAVWDLIYSQIIKPKLDAIKLAVETAWEAIRAAIEEKITAAKTLLASTWDAIATTTTTTLNAFLAFVRDTIFEPLRAAVAERIDAAKTAVSDAWQWMSDKAHAILDPLVAYLRDTIFEPIRKAVETAMTGTAGAATTFGSALSTMKSAVDTTLGALRTVWETTWTAIKTAAESPAQAMNVLIGLVEKLKGVMPTWLIPHSPTPFQVGIEGIAAAARSMNAAFGSAGPGMELIYAIGRMAEDIGGSDFARATMAISALETGGGKHLSEIGGTGAQGPFMFDPGGQLPAFARALGVSLAEAARVAVAEPMRAASWALTGYLGRALRAGMAGGLSGADLAAYAQRTGQVSKNPEAVREWYERLFPGHASGGIFTQPHLAWIAENGPEAVVPLGRSGGSLPSQTVRIDVAIGGRLAEEIYVTGRDLAIRRGRVPGAGAASMASLS
jgi:tape measure domain-containing protein